VGPLMAHPGWQNLPAVHDCGALLGLATALPWTRPNHATAPQGT
jgi:hypothetical protein